MDQAEQSTTEQTLRELFGAYFFDVTAVQSLLSFTDDAGLITPNAKAESGRELQVMAATEDVAGMITFLRAHPAEAQKLCLMYFAGGITLDMLRAHLEPALIAAKTMESLVRLTGQHSDVVWEHIKNEETVAGWYIMPRVPLYPVEQFGILESSLFEMRAAAKHFGLLDDKRIRLPKAIELVMRNLIIMHATGEAVPASACELTDVELGFDTASVYPYTVNVAVGKTSAKGITVEIERTFTPAKDCFVSFVR